uniref:Uncharacterized protein n=1 Tax=Rhodococcus sp. NS1 TaxID=402236 RepID=A0A097SPJ8_9NOCA|nr:hypothetical protein LRS1606.21 [Rhodococcus sp. NS1]
MPRSEMTSCTAELARDPGGSRWADAPGAITFVSRGGSQMLWPTSCSPHGEFCDKQGAAEAVRNTGVPRIGTADGPVNNRISTVSSHGTASALGG